MSFLSAAKDVIHHISHLWVTAKMERERACVERQAFCFFHSCFASRFLSSCSSLIISCARSLLITPLNSSKDGDGTSKAPSSVSTNFTLEPFLRLYFFLILTGMVTVPFSVTV